MAPKRTIELARARRVGPSGEARRIREAAGLSLRDVAAAVGVDHSAIRRWETGQSSPRSASALRWLHLLDELASADKAAAS